MMRLSGLGESGDWLFFTLATLTFNAVTQPWQLPSVSSHQVRWSVCHHEGSPDSPCLIGAFLDMSTAWREPTVCVCVSSCRIIHEGQFVFINKLDRITSWTQFALSVQFSSKWRSGVELWCGAVCTCDNTRCCHTLHEQCRKCGRAVSLDESQIMSSNVVGGMWPCWNLSNMSERHQLSVPNSKGINREGKMRNKMQ